MRKIKIYSDRSFVSAKRGNHCAMMVPFWGMGERPPWCQSHDVFRDYEKNGHLYFDLVEKIDESDVVILPSTLHAYLSDRTEAQAAEFASRASSARKTLLVFHERDLDFRSPFENSVLFSPTLIGRRRPREFGLPAWVDDNLSGPAPVRNKAKKPVVGFCGWVRRPTLKGRVRRFIRMHFPYANQKRLGSQSALAYDQYLHLYLRHNVLRRTIAHNGVVSSVIARYSFYAGSRVPGQAGRDMQRAAIAREEYITNLVNCDYSLCVRGRGNYSARFYETLAAGRLPLFIDTDCILPYEFDMNWHKEFVWLDYKEISNVVDHIMMFHDTLSESDFEERQLRARNLWENWLSPNGFFRNFYRHFGQNGIPLDTN